MPCGKLTCWACLGSIAGILVAIALIAGLKHFGPTSLPRLQDVAIHPIVLLFAVALSLITSLFFGFAPAWRLSRVAPQASLRDQAGQFRPRQSAPAEFCCDR